MHDPNFSGKFDGPVPSDAEFAAAVNNALADEISFLLLNQDDPESIVQRLPRLLDRMRAAIVIKGPYQARAIRFILSIRPRYWLAAYRFKEWGDLLQLALSSARDLKDDTLYGEVVYAWGTYLALYFKHESAGYAFDWSIQKLDAGVDDHVRLLRQLDKFNATVLDMSRDDALARADELLIEARALKSNYFQGRIFHALARYFRNTRYPEEAFMLGQQALCYYWDDPESWQDHIAQVMLTMNAMLRTKTPTSKVHPQHIVDFLDGLFQRMGFNPFVSAKILHEHAVQYFGEGRYEQAKLFVMRAAIQYRLVGDLDGWARIRHMWGQVQRELGLWSQAERHLHGAALLYDELKMDRLYFEAKFSCALIPYKQQDWARAHRLLSDVRELAGQRLTDPNVRTLSIAQVDRYLDEVRLHLC